MKDTDTYRVNWQTLRKDWPLWVLLLGTFLLGIYLAPQLPEQVPTHWNFRGEVDGYGNRATAVYLQPLIAVSMYLLMVFLPLIDPRRANYTRFAGTYQHLKTILVLFFCGFQLTILAAGLGYLAGPDIFLRVGLPLLFIFLGNVMGQIKHNYFVGIKTPWALANEEVWRGTHRAAGRLWVLCGLAGLVAAFMPATIGRIILIIALFAAGIVPFVHSYLLWRHLN
ncbi:MAG: SdpI family protein [bacterium]|jgi:uncharacterized membrane protein